MIAKLAMGHAPRKKGWLRWRKFNDLVEITKRSPWIAHLTPHEMPFEIGAGILWIFLQPSIYDFKIALRIGATKSFEFEYFLRCGWFLHRDDPLKKLTRPICCRRNPLKRGPSCIPRRYYPFPGSRRLSVSHPPTTPDSHSSLEPILLRILVVRDRDFAECG